jgi:hypothetical protein
VTAFAEDGGPGEDSSSGTSTAEWVQTLDLKVRTQPTGLIVDTGVFRRQTVSRPGSLLFDGTYHQGGVDLEVSPALAEVGIHTEWSPIRILILRAEYRTLISYGLLGYTLSFDDANEPFGDNVVERREGDEEAGAGHRFSLYPTVQLKAGPVIVRNLTEVHWNLMTGFDGPLVRERLYDRLQATNDVLVVNTSIVAYELWDGPGPALAIVGPYYEYVRSLESGSERQRIGGVAAWIASDAWGRYRRPRVYLQAGANLVDENREGAVFVQGGFGFDLAWP